MTLDILYNKRTGWGNKFLPEGLVVEDMRVRVPRSWMYKIM